MEEYRKYEPIFGSWYLSKLIGKGSFGKVFEITREDFGTKYKAALKVISVPQDEDDVKSRMAEGTEVDSITEYYEGILKEIINENEIMSKLKGNSNIVSYEDHQVIPHEGSIGYDILIRMELLTPLLDRMVEKKLEEKEVVKLGIDICKALEVCHKKNIIHRDIKPQNIFISDSGDFKLGDFGIAKTMEKTIGGMSKKGTYKYMAPEVFRGEDYDQTVDIYSLGIVLYSLLNGNRSPFLPAPPAKITHNDEEEARMRRFRGEPLPPPRDAGAMLTYILRKAAAANPAERYQSAAKFRKDLESYLKNYNHAKDEETLGFDSEATMLESNVPLQSEGIRPNQNYTGSVPVQAMMQGYTGSMPAQRYTNSMAPVGGMAQQAYGANYYGGQVAMPAGSKNRKKLPLILACALGALVLVGGITLAIKLLSGPKEIDFAELMEGPVISGYDGGFGTIVESPKIDEEKKEELLDSIKSEDERDRVSRLLESATYSLDKTDELNNGDVIKVTVDYDKSLESEIEMNVSAEEKSIEIDVLKELPEEIEKAKAVGTVRYNPKNGNFYMIADPDGGIFWTASNKSCEELGGHLAAILDADEEAFIEKMIEEDGKLYHYWLGASDAEHEGSWKWVTGEKVNLPGEGGFHKWSVKQPNNNPVLGEEGQDYMEIQKTRGNETNEYLTWTDISDSGLAGEQFYGPDDYNETKYYGYICEWDMN